MKVLDRTTSENTLQVLATAFEFSAEFVGLFRPDGMPVFLSASGQKLVGLKSLKAPLLEYFVREDRPHVEREMIASLHRGEAWRGNVRLRHFDTAESPAIELNALVIRDDQGAAIAWLVMSSHLTVAKEEECAKSRTLLESELADTKRLHELGTRIVGEENFDSLLKEVVAVAVSVAGADLGYLQLLGPDRQELYLKACVGCDPQFEKFIARVVPSNKCPCGRAIKTGKRVVVPNIHDDHRIGQRSLEVLLDIDVRSTEITPLVSSHGQVLGVITTLYRQPVNTTEGKRRRLDLLSRQAADQIERKQAELELRSTQRKLQLTQFTVDQAAIAVYWIGRDSLIRFVNDQGCLATGYTREELIGKSIAELGPHLTTDTWEARFDEIRKMTSTRIDRMACRKDGSLFPVEVTMNYVCFQDEEMVVCFVQDNTIRQKIEERLEQQSVELLHVTRLSTMGQMVAALSHELAQPLSAASNYSEACKQRFDGVDHVDLTLRTYVEEIHRQVNRAGDILHRVRDFVRHTVPRRSVYDLKALLKDSTALVASDFKHHEVQIETKFDEEPMMVLIDRVQIQQVIVNLLVNARDAMAEVDPSRRLVTLQCFVSGSEAVIEVSDCGCGLVEEMKDQLFKPFLSSKEAGMGIGLSICHTIVKSHEGQIVARPSDTQGATFTVSLPLAEGTLLDE